MTDATPRYPDLDWSVRWTLIKDAILATGLSLDQVAKGAGLSSVTTVKTKRFPAAQEAIAGVLGVSPAALFPERYSVPWSAALQAEVEQALPGLRGVNVSESIRVARQASTREYWRAIPVDLTGCPADQAERLAWVKDQLKHRGFRIVDLAHELSVKRSAINNLAVVWYSEVQAYLADCLGVPPQAIWPERYAEDGTALASGKVAKASPSVPATLHQLDLSGGLWLPAEALVGLPGVPLVKDALMARARASGWQARQRAGVDEVAFSSLPAETRLFLVGGGGANDVAVDPAGNRKRRYTPRALIECRDCPDPSYDYSVQLDLLDSCARVSIVCVDPGEGQIRGFQGADMSPAELRATATALIEAAQALEIGRHQAKGV